MGDINNPYGLPSQNPGGGDASSFLNGNALQLLIANLQDVTQAVNNLNVTLKSTFPQQGTTSSTATGGAATLPSNPVEFLEVVVSGTTYKVPLYAE